MSGRPLRIGLLEPYDTGSHHAWLRVMPATRPHHHAAHPQRRVLEVAHARRRRDAGAPLSRAGRARRLLLATDMLDLTTFLALTRELTHAHPRARSTCTRTSSPTRRGPAKSATCTMALSTMPRMLCAERVLFNSPYHLESWFDELPRLLKHFPDYNELPTVAALRARSEVLPLGLDLAALRRPPPDAPRGGPAADPVEPPLGVRQEPGEFLRALYALAERGLEFQRGAPGRGFVRVPPEFEEARARLGDAHRAVRLCRAAMPTMPAGCGRPISSSAPPCTTFSAPRWSRRMYCGCLPILPDRLAYPQFIPARAARAVPLSHPRGVGGAAGRAPSSDIDATPRHVPARAVAGYDWATWHPCYDARLAGDTDRQRRLRRYWHRAWPVSLRRLESHQSCLDSHPLCHRSRRTMSAHRPRGLA